VIDLSLSEESLRTALTVVELTGTSWVEIFFSARNICTTMLVI